MKAFQTHLLDWECILERIILCKCHLNNPLFQLFITQEPTHSNYRNRSDPGRNIPTQRSAGLQGAIDAIQLAKLGKIHQLQVNTNIEYVVNIMTKWVEKWILDGWLTADGVPPKNLGTIKELHSLCNDNSIHVKFVSD